MKYYKVIQQNYGHGHGYEDVSEYETNSVRKCKEMSGKFNDKGRELSLLDVDYKEYQLTGHPTRVIFRKVKEQKA